MEQSTNEKDKELDESLQASRISFGILQTPSIYRHDGFFERKDGQPLRKGEPRDICNCLEGKFDKIRFTPVISTKGRHFTIDATPNPERFDLRWYLIQVLSDIGYAHVDHSKGVENCSFYIPG